MENEDNGMNKFSHISVEPDLPTITIDLAIPEKIPERYPSYVDLTPPSYDETIQETTSHRASLTSSIFETTAEVAYGDRSARPSLIGERPLQIRDYLFIVVAFIISFWSIGFLNTLGVMVVELLSAFPDSKAIILMIPSIGIGLSSGAGMMVGFLINKFGCPALIITGGFLQSLALIICVFGNHPMVLLFSMGILFGVGGCFVYVTNSVFVGMYFGNRASVFLSVLCTSGPLGAIVFPFLISLCVDQYGWRGCLLLFSGVYLNIIPLGIFLWFCQKKAQSVAINLPQLPENMSKPKKLFDASVLKNLPFVIFLFTMSTTLGLMNLILSNLPNYLVQNGFSLSMSAQAFSIMFITSIPPKIIIGIILRLTGWSFVYLYIIISICFAIMVFITTLVSGFTPLLCCCVMLGLFIGGPIGLYSLVVLDFTGSQKYSSAMGISETSNGIVIICQGLISGVLINTYGSYHLSFYIFSGIVILANLVMAASLAKEYLKKMQFNFKLFSKA